MARKAQSKVKKLKTKLVKFLKANKKKAIAVVAALVLAAGAAYQYAPTSRIADLGRGIRIELLSSACKVDSLKADYKKHAIVTLPADVAAQFDLPTTFQGCYNDLPNGNVDFADEFGNAGLISAQKIK